MDNQNYLMIKNNVVTNVVLWNGDSQQWQPPSDVIMLVQATTPSFGWVYIKDLQDFELIKSIGGGNIGDEWDGTACITTQPKPPKPEPAPTPSSGAIPTTTI